MEIEYKQWHEVIELATKQRGMWAVYVSNKLDCESAGDKLIRAIS